MFAQVPPADLERIARDNGITYDELLQRIERVKVGMLPFARVIPIIEDGEKRYYSVERRGVGPIVTKHGKYWMYDFSIDDAWRKYTVIVACSDLDPESLSPIFRDQTRLVLRTDSGCETGQMFGDLTCECGDQLHLAMETIAEAGEGMIINIPTQDGRGMGLPFKLGTLWLQEDLGVNTVESAAMLAPGGVIDIRTYSGVIAILEFFNIPHTCEINLATNNPKKASIFGENGYAINADFTPMVIPPTKHTAAHLAAKAMHLGHRLDTAPEPT